MEGIAYVEAPELCEDEASRSCIAVRSVDDHVDMSTRVSSGEAFSDGHSVACLVLHEEWVEEAVPVPIPGTNRTGYKDLSHPGPAYLEFDSVSHPDLRSRLERLVEFASADIDRKRVIRNAGQRSVALDLAIDGGRYVAGARVEPPLVGHTAIEATLFPVVLPG